MPVTICDTLPFGERDFAPSPYKGEGGVRVGDEDVNKAKSFQKSGRGGSHTANCWAW